MDPEDWRSRIEQKLDTLSEVLIQLARIEERQIVHLNDMQQIKAEVGEHDERIRKIEQVTQKNAVSVSNIERFGWIAMTAAIGAFATFFE